MGTGKKVTTNKNEFAVIFDMDGVLVDNSDYHFKSWVHIAKKLDFNLTLHYYKQYLNGRVGSEIIKRFSKTKLSEQEIKKLGKEKDALYRKLFRPHIRPVKGLVNFLANLEKHGVKRALATSAPHENVIFVLGSTKTRKFLKHIVNASHVTKGKPNPEVFLKAAGLLNMKPKNCVVFEDALNGIKAAQRAKMKVVAIATTNKPQDLKHANLVVKDFSGLTVEKLEKLFK